MMSVSDFFYGPGGREPVWIVRTPNSVQKTAANNPQTPQSANRVTPSVDATQYNSFFYAGREPAWIQRTPNSGPRTPSNNPETPQSANRVMFADGLNYNSAVELKVPVCCEACEERVKHALLTFSGVESVMCDTFTQRVTVTGTAAPADLLRICRKLHKRSELLQKGSPAVIASPRWGFAEEMLVA